MPCIKKLEPRWPNNLPRKEKKKINKLLYQEALINTYIRTWTPGFPQNEALVNSYKKDRMKRDEILKYDQWQPYVDYEKAECDIKLKDGRIIKHVYPNAGKFNRVCGKVRGNPIPESEVSEIMYREYYMKDLCKGECNQ